MTRYLAKLALVSQLVGFGFIIPAPLMMVLGPLFFVFLVALFCGWRWAPVYLVLTSLISGTQMAFLIGSAAVVTPIAPAAAVSNVQQINYGPILSALQSGVTDAIDTLPPTLRVTFALGAIYLVNFVSIYVIFMWPYLSARAIRARLPASMWKPLGRRNRAMAWLDRRFIVNKKRDGPK